MKKNLNLTFIATFVLWLLFFNSCDNKQQLSEEQFESIITNFQTPADDNTVWCYWYWINDDISKEGITKDLEAMKEAGIGAALIGNINPAGVDGKVPLFSNEWWECMVHAVTEGDRIGVDIGIFNCPGWSQSGGPWVKSNMAMRYLTFSETTVAGPGAVNIKLAQPNEEFQDTHTLAFKTPVAEKQDLKSRIDKITSNSVLTNMEALIDNDISTSEVFKTNQNETVTLEFKLKQAIKARQLSLTPSIQQKCDCEFYAVVDGQEKLITEFLFDRSNTSVNVGPIIFGAVAVSIPETESNQFKLVCKNIAGNGARVGFSEIKQ